MEKEELFKYVRSMITSSTHRPKYMSISTVKVADLLGVSITEVENGLNELIADGRLTTTKLDQPDKEVYMLQ
ncbi:PCI domain-containing protein [Neobacillus cucumis]|uniref:PCI domain-containing protein n=1 Tax=Neobacillus cucumis TaxID=1740721 RepID=UPI002852FA35|nr:PCI domain-containing protein [Neobacillus cucumis]MDR4947976.1 PCI domain-containing protein [Neobacillus cucumis]